MPPELRAVHFAKAWRLSPSQWRALPVDDRGQMMAHDQYEAITAAYRDEWRESKKDRGNASNDFEAMKKRLAIKNSDE